MKIAVINFSGNVGKTTVARHLLAPRMNDAEVIPVESINSDGTEETAIRGKQYGEMQEYLLTVDDAVIDIGASNVEDFINLMRQYRGSHEDFDYFVVPTVPASKQQRDTISTIESLSDNGVPAKKIRLVFNMVGVEDHPERIFSGLFEYQRQEKKFVLKPEAVIHVNDIYGKIKGSERGIIDILTDDTDYKQKIKEAANSEEKLHYAQLLSVKRLAAGVKEELDGVFKVLFK
jgi:MinD-like ATPase involved in chromosome partitioning or flagellar assembly